MNCNDSKSCISEINAYCNAAPIGKALLVNAENYDVYQKIRATLEADTTKKCIYVSKACPKDGLPDYESIINQVAGAGCHVLIGLSQAVMLRGAAYLKRVIGTLLEKPIRDHAVILLDHCEQYLKNYFSIHPDIQKRVLLLTQLPSLMPRIRLAASEDDCIGYTPLIGFRSLLSYLENATDATLSDDPEIAVVTQYTPALFKNAMYSVTACDGAYEGLSKQYPEIAAGTQKNYGSDEQWKYLATGMKTLGSLSALAEKTFGSAANLSSYIGQVSAEADDNKMWFLWLAMKMFGAKGNKYLSRVLQNSNSVSDFEEHVYLDLLETKHTDKEFRQYYTERKHLIEILPENMTLLDKYCERVGIYQKDAVFYLTSSSEKEELAFMKCLATYDYSEEELLRITGFAFPALNTYLQRFAFNVTNTKLPSTETDLRDTLTDYFCKYKLQKLTNRIYPAFLERVEEFANVRPYNKLQARSSVVSKLDKKNAQLFFFDALGVEYLAYIMARCDKYGLIAEVSIAQCNLPSITSKNKEFIHFFHNEAKDIKELDELKHHNQVIDYQQCKLPIHLFRELEIIDTELRKIQSQLKQGHFDKAIIVSDHGASRLAVIHEQENDQLELEEKGKHSGRCCPVGSDPGIPAASYWDGYAILANYDRIKGGRKANVEVHGGASLEEVVVPIITLTKKPTDIEICFVDSLIILKGKETAAITVYSNIPLHEPKLIVGERVYQGTFCEDSKHVKFEMPELKRTKDWTADFYDGDKKLAKDLVFRVQKGTQEQSLFKKMPF